MLKDQQLANQVYESINIILEAENELYKYAEEENLTKFSDIARLILEMNEKIDIISKNIVVEEEGLSLDKAVISINDSLSRIIQLMLIDRENALKKIEYELIPLTEECRINFYFWGLVSGNKEKEKKYLEEEIFELAKNKYIDKSIKTGVWKYDLSIVVLAYNKLDYTKKCISNLLKYYPRWLRTELILINHGSEDETKEYLESINPDKLLDIKINGGGVSAIHRITEGRYILSISNDVFVQYNTINNLYDCISSDSSIAYVVPSTPNVSNLQTISAVYSNEDELYKFVKSNNYNNSSFREQRTRLCNPIDITDSIFDSEYKPHYRFYSKNIFSFPDDNVSLLCRRNGKKMMLVKDAYCYHCGSVTLKDDNRTNSELAFQKGRYDFKNRYGIDPWFKCGYAYWMVNNINYKKNKNCSVLALNGGFGSNGLKIKEELRYNNPDFDVYLKYVLTTELYYDDVKYLGNEAIVIKESSELLIDKRKYDYIVIEDISEIKDSITDLVNVVFNISDEHGIIIFETFNDDDQLLNEIKKYKENIKLINDGNINWIIIEKNNVK